MTVKGNRIERGGNAQKFYWGAAVVLFVLAGYYLIGGMTALLWGDPWDLQRRWVDQQYFYRGQNPYDVLFANDPALKGTLPVPANRNSQVDPAIGSMHAGGYPPWSFIPGTFLTGFPRALLRPAFAFYNLIAIGLIIAWSWARTHPHGPAAAAFLAAASIAMMPARVTLAYGQYGLLIMAFLIVAAWASEHGNSILTGLMLGLAATKPNIAGPFFLCFLFAGRWRAVIWSFGFLVVCSTIVWIVTKTNPLEMMNQMSRAAEVFVDDMPNLIKLLVAFHVPKHLAVQFIAASGLVVGFALMRLMPDASLVTLFAVAAVVGRLWSYHRPYDDVMLVPLLLALGLLFVRNPRSILPATAFFAVGLSLWLPLTFRIKWPGVVLQHMAWIAGAAIVFSAELIRQKTSGEPSMRP